MENHSHLSDTIRYIAVRRVGSELKKGCNVSGGKRQDFALNAAAQWITPFASGQARVDRRFLIALSVGKNSEKELPLFIEGLIFFAHLQEYFTCMAKPALWKP